MQIDTENNNPAVDNKIYAQYLLIKFILSYLIMLTLWYLWARYGPSLETLMTTEGFFVHWLDKHLSSSWNLIISNFICMLQYL